VLIRGAEVEGRAPLDVRIAGGRVAELGARLARAPGEEVLEACGGALLPGLHDHHAHLLALAASLASVRCGPPEVGDARALARALRAAEPAHGWLRGVGYHESVAGPLDRAALDRLRADVPLRVQHRSGAAWLLNSAGVARLGLDAGADARGVERDARGRATGRLFRLDAWLRERLGPAAPPRLDAVGRRLSSFGVTGVSDATATNGAREVSILAAARRRGELPQRLCVMGEAGLAAPPGDPGLWIGARKLVLDDAALTGPDALERQLREAHAEGRGVAVHCVTRAELCVALAAFAAAGVRPGDRIEHAAVAPPEAAQQLAALGLTVVTQPHFVHERGDAYLRDVEPRERPWLYRCRGLLEAGVCVGGGSDAPFGGDDPWRAMRAAVSRRTRDGRPFAPGEALSPERALALFTSPPQAPGAAPRAVGPGFAADLCLLDLPWRAARRALSSRHVRATLCGGRVAFRRAEGSGAESPQPVAAAAEPLI
jgi:predicted amidohydrolase YtcJ